MEKETLSKQEILELKSKGYSYSKRLGVPTFKVDGKKYMIVLCRYSCDERLAIAVESTDHKICEIVTVNLANRPFDPLNRLKIDQIFLDIGFEGIDLFAPPVLDLLGAEQIGCCQSGFNSYPEYQLKEGFERYCIDERES